MSGIRSFHACLKAAERDAASRIIPFRSPSDRHATAPVYGTAHRLNPVWVEDRENTCPSCHARAWHVGRVTAECAACETVLPIVRGVSIRGRVQ